MGEGAVVYFSSVVTPRCVVKCESVLVWEGLMACPFAFRCEKSLPSVVVRRCVVVL